MSERETIICAAERVMGFYRELCRTGGVMTTKDQKKYGRGAYPELNEARRLRCWKRAIERAAELYGLEFEQLAKEFRK